MAIHTDTLSTSSTVITSEQVFIDLNGPAALDDLDDPVYPYSPPSLQETLRELSRAPPRSLRTLILSVPSRSRSKSTTEAVQSLASFLKSPTCSSLRTLRISGSLQLLNDRHLQDALKLLDIRELILQESQSLHDLYALAGLLASLTGITSLHLALDSSVIAPMHSSFAKETSITLSHLTTLHLNLHLSTSRNAVVLQSVFEEGRLASLEHLSLAMQYKQGAQSPAAEIAVLLRAGSGFSRLRNLQVTQAASDTASIRNRNGMAYASLLSLPQLESVEINAANPAEHVTMPIGMFEDMPSSLQNLELAHAGPRDPCELYRYISTSLDSWPSLRRVKLTHMYPDNSVDNQADNDGWEYVRISAGHPGAIKQSASTSSRALAMSLEARGISYHIKLLGETDHEELVYLNRSP